MFTKNKQAFTLVELIVVITILAILGTIGFISMQSYAASSRDSVRLTDLQLIGKSLDLYQVKTGKYPDPSNGFNVTFSGAEVRTQGTFGNINYKNVEKLNKLPLDPLIENEYTYSVLNNKKEYQLGAILETRDILGLDKSLINKIQAVDKNAIALVKGNYNGIVAKVLTGSLIYALALPSIINSEIGDVDILEIIQNNKMVFNGYGNLPGSYNNSGYNLNSSENINFVNSGSIVIFAGNIDELNIEENQILFVSNLQDAFSGTILQDNSEISNILKTDTISDIQSTVLLGQVLIQNTINPQLEITGASNLGYGIQIKSGNNFSCAKLLNKTVKCWGWNYYGQVGDGTTYPTVVLPTLIDGLSNVESISTGWAHACALLGNSTVKCWGSNSYGQIGIGNSGTNILSPVLVDGLTNVRKISLGSNTSCAILNDSTVKCWGSNSYGQIGDGTKGTNVLSPVLVDGLENIEDIGIGVYHTCALISTGTVKCWGYNVDGQIGDGNSGNYVLTPYLIDGLNNVKKISVGYYNTCGLMSDGTVKCWGNNTRGQIGNGTSGDDVLLATSVNGLSNVSDIKLGSYHACALISGGTVKCWGNNSSRELGDGTNVNKALPSLVIGLSEVEDISLGWYYTCVNLKNGIQKCWGSNSYGQLGDGTTSGGFYPNITRFLSGVDTLSLGAEHSCAKLLDGSIKCWGYNNAGQLGDGSNVNAMTPINIPILNGVSKVYSGNQYSCAVFNDKTAKCWGYNNSGQLGDGTTTSRKTPELVNGLTNVESMSLGGTHACALLSDKTVKCWGNNLNGQLGDGTHTKSYEPITVNGLSNVEKIVLGSNHSCAIISDGTVKCWGSNRYGEIGNGAGSVGSHVHYAISVPSLNNVTSISLGDFDTCALLADKTVKCWGRNFAGQLGDSTSTDKHSPTTVYGLTDAEFISIGNSNSCAIISDGTVKCWGGSRYGEVGLPAASLVPLKVEGLSNVEELSSGFSHNCAKISDGTVKCWGKNNYGQLGIENFDKRTVLLGN